MFSFIKEKRNHLKAISLDESGFTLMELMATVTIVAVLALIALPTFSGRMDAAKNTGTRSNLRSAAVAVAGEKNDNGYWDADINCTAPAKLTELVDKLNDGSPYEFKALCSRADVAYWLDPSQETLGENDILVYMPLGGNDGAGTSPGDVINLFGRSKAGNLYCIKLAAVGAQTQGKQDNSDYATALSNAESGPGGGTNNLDWTNTQCSGIGWSDNTNN